MLETLEAVDKVINDKDFDTLVWCGDINADCVRNSGHVRETKNFINERHLTKAWDVYDVDFTHFNELNGVTNTSTIDHFFLNETAISSLASAGVLHLLENTSDHCPVYCVLDTNGVSSQKPRIPPGNPKPSWKRAEPEETENCIHNLKVTLNNIETPTCAENCDDVHCQKDDHIESIDKYTEEVFEALGITALSLVGI